MNKVDLIDTIKGDKAHCKRMIKKEIEVIRNILNRVEASLDDDNFYADNGLQGNEWRLYKELSNLERLNEFSKQVEKITE